MRKKSNLTYQRQQLLKTLQDLVARHGESLTLDEFCRHTGISATPIWKQFGGWSQFRRAAGLSPRGKKSAASAQFSHQQLCRMLVEAAGVYGDDITLAQFLQSAGISATPIYHLFGSWSALQQAAGLCVQRRRLSNGQLQALHIYRHVSGIMESDTAPTSLKELIACSRLSTREVEKHFGDWETLLDLMMIETRGDRLDNVTEEELQQIYQATLRTYNTVRKYLSGEEDDDDNEDEIILEDGLPATLAPEETAGGIED